MKGKRVLKKQRNNDSLLSTYFVSLFSVLLCFVMLFGTTFAWFYTGNSSVGNEIHSGILKVDMIHDGVSLARQPEHAVFSSNVLWSPDRTAQEEQITVCNTGDVWLDYKLDFVPVPNKEAAVTAAALFTVYVNGRQIGTLDEFLGDAADASDDILLATGQDLAPGESADIRIELQLNTALVHNVMGHSVPVYLKLEAYQSLAGVTE